MIILYSKKINYNFTEILYKYESKKYNIDFHCPKCMSKNLIKWGSYDRILISCKDNKSILKTIKIQRLRCKDCKRTHALLPSFIVPYKIFALDFIINSISNKNSFLLTNYDTCVKWNKQFNTFLPFLKTMMKTSLKIEVIEKLLNDIFNIYKIFFDRNNKILMMMRPGIYSMAPF